MSQSYFPLGQGNQYLSLNHSNLPISFDSDPKKTCFLKLTSIKLGHNGQFSKLANQKKYTCYFKVTKDFDPDCFCPIGTIHENENLYDKIYEANQSGEQVTCAEAQQKWCEEPFSYECSSNTSNPHMDITNCVFTKRAQGYTKEGALQACESTMCEAKGVKFIYRTIDLANPFPGKDSDHRFSSLTIGDFNYDVKGRYPGTNWNSKTLVAKEILNNRGVAANKVYGKEVTPLYTITLDPNMIKKIRTYNSVQKKNDEGYSDFTLSCKKGVACLSNQFLRDVLGNHLVGGTCKNANHDSFYQCSQSGI